MALGITEEDVRGAADAIVGRGERPTIERIRAELGRGSPNTVNRHLDAWWATLPKRLAPQADDLPDEVVQLARRIWTQVLPVANHAAEQHMAGTARELNERAQRLHEAETALTEKQRALSEVRIALDRRIGELEAALATRDQALAEARQASDKVQAELKATRASLQAAEGELSAARALHTAETSKLAERLAGNEKRLMERLAEEKAARDVDASTARKRIKSLEDELRGARKLMEDQTAAGLKVQASFRAELDALRKLLTREPTKRATNARAGRAAARSRKSANRS
ncbi:DNA-binding protein [Sinimarinibacterium flocculans]|uniref:DNA-binding protein n=1 Tax=Sinimarinibacterium flocculans TaxID=985250 RepID=UPI0035133D65